MSEQCSLCPAPLSQSDFMGDWRPRRQLKRGGGNALKPEKGAIYSVLCERCGIRFDCFPRAAVTTNEDTP
jgi:hypothetical protein